MALLPVAIVEQLHSVEPGESPALAFDDHQKILGIAETGLVPVFAQDEKLPVEVSQIIQFAGDGIFFFLVVNDKFIGGAQKTPGTAADVAVDRANVFVGLIEEVQHGIVEMIIIADLKPGTAQVKMRFLQILSKMAHHRQYKVKVLVEIIQMRQFFCERTLQTFQ